MLGDDESCLSSKMRLHRANQLLAHITAILVSKALSNNSVHYMYFIISWISLAVVENRSRVPLRIPQFLIMELMWTLQRLRTLSGHLKNISQSVHIAGVSGATSPLLQCSSVYLGSLDPVHTNLQYLRVSFPLLDR